MSNPLIRKDSFFENPHLKSCNLNGSEDQSLRHELSNRKLTPTKPNIARSRHVRMQHSFSGLYCRPGKSRKAVWVYGEVINLRK